MVLYYSVKNGACSRLLSKLNIHMVIVVLLSFVSVFLGTTKNGIVVTAKATTTSTTSTAFIVETTTIHQRQRQRQRQRRNQHYYQQNNLHDLIHHHHQIRLPTSNLYYNINNNNNNDNNIERRTTVNNNRIIVAEDDQMLKDNKQQLNDNPLFSVVNEWEGNSNNQDIITTVRSALTTFVAVTTFVTTILLSTTILDETLSSSSIIQPVNAAETIASTSTEATGTVTNRKETNAFLLTSSSSESTAIKTQPILTTSTTTVSSSLDTTNTIAAATATATATATTSTSTSTRTVTMRNIDGTIDWESILRKAYKKAIGGGTAGAFAAIVQVCSLMWLRTSMNYQYRYGGTLQSSLSTLYEQGGVSRLYQGLPFALVQGPLTRFGDTAANVGILSLLESLSVTSALPLPIKTLCTSIVAGLWRIALMPIDTSKTILQVEGPSALQQLWTTQLSTNGIGVLYRGSIAQALATTVGHFPWFLTYNFLDDIISKIPPTIWISLLTSSSSLSSSPISTDSVLMSDTTATLLWTLSRAAIIGVSASCISDCSSNSLRVLKTFKQTAALGGMEVIGKTSTITPLTTTPSTTLTTTAAAMTGIQADSTRTTSSSTGTEMTSKMESILTNTTITTSSLLQDQTPTTITTSTAGVDMSYQQILQQILEKDGWIGLFGRGLQTRLLTNAIQGAAFSVLWKYFQQQLQQQ